MALFAKAHSISKLIMEAFKKRAKKQSCFGYLCLKILNMVCVAFCAVKDDVYFGGFYLLAEKIR